MLCALPHRGTPGPTEDNGADEQALEHDGVAGADVTDTVRTAPCPLPPGP